MPTADLILKNANVITINPRQPNAGLVAIAGDKILLAGNNEALETVRDTKTKVIDCQGKTVVPGFNDTHCHIFSFVRKLLSVDLSPLSVRSIADIKAALHRAAQNIPPGKWLNGTGYNEFYLAEKHGPNRWDIDDVVPNHPVLLSHRSLHACVLNTLALSLAGINRETPDPPGGLIERDLDTGEPTGVLFEMLGYIREQVMPAISEEELTRGVSLANQSYLSQGITSLQEATSVNSLKQWQRLQRLKASGTLKSRVYFMPSAGALNHFLEAGLAPGSGDNQLRVGAVKVMLSEATGQLYPPQPELNQQALDAHRAGYQLAIHALEASTVEAAITALEYAQSYLPKTDLRHRIEHCSECPPTLLKRLSKLNVVIATQPPFVYYSGERYLAQVPADRQQWLYRFKSFLDIGLTVAGGSDSPIVPNNPLVGMYAAITRRTESGQYLLPHEGVSASQALAMYTTSAAYASLEEENKGSIVPGKLADMVVLSDDPLKPPPEKLKDIRVEMTILGGKIVWEA